MSVVGRIEMVTVPPQVCPAGGGAGPVEGEQAGAGGGAAPAGGRVQGAAGVAGAIATC